MRKALMQCFLVAGALYLMACGGGIGSAAHCGPKSGLNNKASCTVTRSADSYTTVLTGGQPNFLYLVEVGGVNDPLHTFSGQVSDENGTASFSGVWYENTEIKVLWSEYPHITGNKPVAHCSAESPGRSRLARPTSASPTPP
ncbi:hypothetical protein [Polyangium jinanense]|uniref:Uncharacterized protein n=1 Tax=Polyangium jinanense TaxID=2829994 RepID=A0A9X3XHT6_9BACT|nr:hypothetical protein [Polyangium jinanense]MDC3962247.1 hypothetical protein [Polyangium jinanense]MDC3988938.1 hypothetical protein [Polyangium jinanense]